MRIRSGGSVLALAAASALLVLVLPGSTEADTTTSLPITSYYQMVVDASHDHIYISEGGGQNAILVTDLTGQVITTISGENGAEGIALSPDGTTLYAALSTADAVSAIDTTTLQQVASYPLGAGDSPRDVAVQSGELWVSYGNGTAGEAGIGDIDVSSASPSFQVQPALGGWYGAPELSADPQDTGILVAAEPDMTPSAVASYDVAVDPAAVLAQSASFENCTNESDLAVAPGGSEFVLACSSPDVLYRYSTTDLSQLGSYVASGSYPDAVAIAASGEVAGGTQDSWPTADVYVYQQDVATAATTYALGFPRMILAARGLVWSADGSRLYAMMQDGSDAYYTLQIVDAATLTPATLSLTGPSTGYVGESLTLTGTLTIGGGVPPAGTPVTIFRTLYGSTATTIFPVTTSAAGGFTLTDTPAALGQYTYTASYTGNATTAEAATAQSVDVTPDTTSTALGETGSGPAGPVTFTAIVTDTADSLNNPVTTGSVAFFDNGGATAIATAASGTGALAGTFTATVTYTGAGQHSVIAVYTPPAGSSTYQGSTSGPVTFAETAPACNACSNTATIEATVPVGALAISTPYTPANPLNLGALQLDPTGSYFTASAPLEADSGNVPTAGQVPDDTFNGITIVDTQAGNVPWAVTAISSDLSDGGSGAGSVISGENVGLTNLTAVPVPGNALTAADLTFFDQPAALPPAGPADTGDQGLGGTIPHLIVQDATQATGTIGVNGTVTLNAPTSTQAGTFVGTIALTISS